MTQVATVKASGTSNLTSVEIAELTGKRHDNVLKDIEKMLKELGISPTEFSGGYTDQQGKPRPCFSLPPREVKILITGYDVVRRAKVIDRLEQLGVDLLNFEVTYTDLLPPHRGRWGSPRPTFALPAQSRRLQRNLQSPRHRYRIAS